MVNIIQRKLLKQDRNIQFVELTAQLPNGTHTHKTVIDHPGAVVMIPMMDTETVILIRQYRYALAQTVLELPAGTLEPNEDPLTAAQRELQEEIGYQAQTLAPAGMVYPAVSFTNEILHFFIATGLTPSTLPPDDDELIQVVNMPLDEAITQVKQGNIRDAKTILGLYHAKLTILG